MGFRQRTCIRGPMLFPGKVFLSSSPALLGRTLNTVFYPSILSPFWGPCGPCEYTGGAPPTGLSLTVLSGGIKCCLALRFHFTPAHPGSGKGLPAADANIAVCCVVPGSFHNTRCSFCAAALPNTVSVTFFIRISLILWGHKPI